MQDWTLNSKYNEHSLQAKEHAQKQQPESASYTCVPWVSERCQEFSASKPSQEMMRRDTKMRREEGEEKNGQKARDKNATLVHQITHTNRHIMLSGNQYFPYLHSRQFISVCIVGPPSVLKGSLLYIQIPKIPQFLYRVSSFLHCVNTSVMSLRQPLLLALTPILSIFLTCRSWV
jgi:hypothetical protein